ncbi:MAG: single-stranded DNA-binding protein [Candidatus Uhrbacteria bacterium]|nr:single-stranded DNA-binding protein [Candidatus Uhrbacteria bacterium]
MFKASIIGNLGGDPQPRVSGTGTKMTSFSVGVRTGYGSKEATVWVRVTAFGRLADTCAEHLRKGSKVYIDGTLTVGTYERGGETKVSTDLTAADVQFLSPKSDDKRALASRVIDHIAEGNKRAQDKAAAPADDDDIPF